MLGITNLNIPHVVSLASSHLPAHEPPASASQPSATGSPVTIEQDWSVLAFTDGEVDGAGGSGRHGDEDGLATFAKDGEGAVSAFETETLDVRADCFGDSQSVERE
jgi:hypothetical protein